MDNRFSHESKNKMHQKIVKSFRRNCIPIFHESVYVRGFHAEPLICIKYQIVFFIMATRQKTFLLIKAFFSASVIHGLSFPIHTIVFSS